MSVFHRLQVAAIERLGKDSVKIEFEVPKDLSKNFAFEAGQYISLKLKLDGEELRRSYSICSVPPMKKGLLKKARTNSFSIGVKEVENGKVSTYLNKELKEGDSIEMMEPAGKFTLGKTSGHYVMCAGGSGITPILSQIYSILHQQEKSTVVLNYANKSLEDAMFLKEIQDLQSKFSNRFFVYHFLSRATDQPKKDDTLYGRMKASTAYKIGLKHGKDANYFLCGPAELIQQLKDYLPIREVKAEQIHIEYFTASVESPKQKKKDAKNANLLNAKVVYEGLDYELKIPEGSRILDAVLAAGIDAPFSCQSGVCCTCQAKGEFGDFDVSDCLSLSDAEKREGQVLTCVGRIIRDNITVDYDAS